MRRLRPSVAGLLVASGLSLVVGAPDADAEAASLCQFDPAEGTLIVETVADNDGVDNAITVARTAGGTFQVSGDGFDGSTDCGGATVTNVDTVVVHGNGTDELTAVIDQSNGPFAPGKTPTKDVFAPDGAEVGAPEIEVDVHLPNRVETGHDRLVIRTTEGDDQVRLTGSFCSLNTDAQCRAVKANINAQEPGDTDDDVRAVLGARGEGLNTSGAVFVLSLGEARLDAGAGDDIVEVVGTANSDAVKRLRVDGGPGDDRISPGPWRSTVSGGSGDDVIVGASAGGSDALDADGGPGADEITGSRGGDTLAGGTGNDVLRDGDDPAGAQAWRDRLLGGPGDDELHATLGDDTLDGGPGNDTVDGGDGIDTVDASTSPEPVTVDLAVQRLTEPEGADTLMSIEAAIGSPFDDVIVGDADPNRLDGGAGNDRLAGGPGRDHLLGREGDDALDGGAGDDVLDGGIGRNSARFSGSRAPVEVDLALAQARGADVGFDRLVGIDDVVGGDGDDALIGHGGANRLEGGDGDDVLTGWLGDDQLEGGAGDDRFPAGDVPDGSDLVLGGSGRDTVDYSQRTSPVAATPDGIADDGEQVERDDISADIEVFTLPQGPFIEQPSGLRQVATLSALHGQPCRTRQKVVDELGPCPMLVDEERSLGITWGQEHVPGGGPSGPTRLVIYDLDRVIPIFRADDGCDLNVGDPRCPVLASGAVDDVAGRVYAPQGGPLEQPDIPRLESPSCELSVIEYGPDPYNPTAFEIPYSDTCEEPLIHFGISVDSATRTLYASGTWREEDAVRRVGRGQGGLDGLGSLYQWTSENDGQALVLRSVRIEGPNLRQEWSLDLRYAGCGRRPQSTSHDPALSHFVGRFGDDLVVQCWDPKFGYWSGGPLGEQGYLVRIPLDRGGRPLLRGEAPVTDTHGALVNYRAVRTATLPGSSVRALAEPSSGAVMLITDGPINGNAVWVFDPGRDGFVGVLSGGAADQPPNNTAVGVDRHRGLVYVLTKDGMLVAPTRQRPLPAGQVFPVAANDGVEQEVREGPVFSVPTPGEEATIGPLPCTTSGTGCTSRVEKRPVPNWANYPFIGVAPKVRRLFVPVNLPDQCSPYPCNGANTPATEAGPRFVVLEDRLGLDPGGGGADPDDNTVQVDERPGETEASTSGRGTASGAHVVVVGGVARTVDSLDPGCRFEIPGTNFTPVTPISIEPEVFGNGECAADQVVAPGHREWFFAAALADAGTSEGAVADASGFSYGSSDVTGSDVKSAGACGRGQFNSLTRGQFPQQFQDGYSEACDGAWDGAGSAEGAPDPRTGTAGRDGEGFPVPASFCADFGGSAGEDADAVSPLTSSAVSCDRSSVSARAASRAAGFSLGAGDTVVAAAESRSSIATAKLAEGQVTVVAASARGVVAGPLAVREVRSVAVTTARGRTGTATTDIERRWCGVTLNEDDPLVAVPEARGALEAVLPRTAHNCIDPEDAEVQAFLETLNQFAPRLRISTTLANGQTGERPLGAGEASPGGYQAVVVKDPETRGGDEVVNDDQSFTVAGMEVILFNDGSQGRNRVVVQLAGVHAESRYGVTLLPQFAGFDGFFSTGSFESAPSGRRVIPGTRRLPSASTIIEGGGFEELFSTSPLPENPIRRFLGFLPEALGDLWRLFVQHPLEFLLLFFVFSLLGTPAYLAYRRRTFVGVVAG